ncbi:ArnT family glycosyltransferase [Maribacter sp. ACAM166]|uniref:ArnT family glycosyltransferase n=1 Tax=Maribacter sp. ACAM166 TaxID=2508996 RepID=UPI0010FDC3BA|nr:glycosyltransferase family 39 protein [Maribacter sp. ACAM166]TLP81628.1 glycosyltransferase family 39 protein [Maribacter sp. ACAM166]
MIGKNVYLKGITLLGFVSCLSITLITLFKNALELEDAEQAYYSQWLRWGYDDQPPLYTWLQYGFNKVFGVNKISFSVFRGLLFGGTLLFLYRFAKLRIKDGDKSKLTVLVLVLVPVFIDFTFRRLSHTSLLCFCIVGTYYCIQLLIHTKSILNYLLLGVFVSIGILSKYNYMFFLLTFFLVSIWDKELQSTIWNFKILITISISLLCVLPHGYWLLGPSGYLLFLEESIRTKIGTDEVYKGFSIMPNVLCLKGFLALVYLILVGLLGNYFLKHIKLSKPANTWFIKMFIVQLIVLGLFFTFIQIQKVETRWLLPLFIPFTVVLLESVKFKNSKKFVTIGFWAFYVMIFTQTIRTPVEKFLEIPSSVHYGFEPIGNKLQEKYNDYQWILPNVTFAGNIRLLHSEKTIIAADDYSLSTGNLKTRKVIRVSLNKLNESTNRVVDSIIGFGKEKQNLYFYIELRD